MSSIESLKRALTELLHALVRHQRQLWALRVLAALALALGLAVTTAQAGTPAGLLWLFAAGWLLFAVVFGVATLRAPTVERAARISEGLVPQLGTSPSSALDLWRQMESGGFDFSKDLAARHIGSTAERLAESRLVSLHEAARRPTMRRARLNTVGATCLLLVALVVMPRGRARLLQWLVDPTQATLSDRPLASDIRLAYRYPAYTELPARVIEGGDGSISALSGTEVEFAAATDEDVKSARIRVETNGEKSQSELLLKVEGGRRIQGKLMVINEGRYFLSLVTDDGERVEERHGHPIRIQPDAYPKVDLDQPAADIEIRDNQTITVRWRVSDDFGVSQASLLVGEKRVPLGTAEELKRKGGGDYHLSLATLGLLAQDAVRIQIEALDNDTVNGPKRATSRSITLNLFSDKKHHAAIQKDQAAFLDAMVDWLAQELIGPAASLAHGALVTTMAALQSRALLLVAAMEGDPLSTPEVITAFQNVLAHIKAAQAAREAALKAAGPGLARAQTKTVAVLEADIIYIDDLLAILRIHELKETAKDLLAAQRELKDLVNAYQKTQSPELRQQLSDQIQKLRGQMLELLARMSEIKAHLPSEYRNIESATMLQLDDQLQRLEQQLADGDLEQAAAELEQLANMIENMVNGLQEAEDEYGGERYQETREQLADFAERFRKIEAEQKALADRAQELKSAYRRQTMEQLGPSMKQFVDKLRSKAHAALGQLDSVEDRVGRQTLENARQRLIDLDVLLEHEDFSEALEEATRGRDQLRELQRQGGTRDAQSRKATSKAQALAEEIVSELSRLFPKPQEVMTPEQMSQLERMLGEQEALSKAAGELGQKMDELSTELPLFGAGPRQSLEQAKSEMGAASGSLRNGDIPGGAQHKRQAAEQLGKLRQSLEQASKGGNGGLPLPLGLPGQSGGRGREGSRGFHAEDVEIPGRDQKSAGPKFRDSLMEAAKQQAPDGYVEPTRRYYEELIK